MSPVLAMLTGLSVSRAVNRGYNSTPVALRLDAADAAPDLLAPRAEPASQTIGTKELRLVRVS